MLKIYLDAGHGGLKNGRYTTAPSKQFQHKNGKEYHGQGWFFEGVFNRAVVTSLESLLRGHEVPFLTVSHPTDDTTLFARVKRANDDFRTLQAGTQALYISVHANASPTQRAFGAEVFSLRSTGASARAAKAFEKAFIKHYSERQWRDCKQAQFYVLRNTVMPAILTENFFFDNPTDADIMISDYDRIARVHFDAIQTYFDTLL